MPRIVDYEQVLRRMEADGFRCLYYNSGAFGFAPGVATRTVGWVGPPDETIRPAARPFTRPVSPPYERNMADGATQFWQERLAGKAAWVMPKSHWAYELDFGSRPWMPAALEKLGLRAEDLAPRTNGSAIEFEPGEAGAFRGFVEELLTRLFGSDFTLAWPGEPVVCTVHFHKQLWWTTTDERWAGALDEIAPPPDAGA